MVDIDAVRVGDFEEALREAHRLALGRAVFPASSSRVHDPRSAASPGPALLVSLAGWMSGCSSFSQARVVVSVLSVLPRVTIFDLRSRSSVGDPGPEPRSDWHPVEFRVRSGHDV